MKQKIKKLKITIKNINEINFVDMRHATWLE